MRIGSVRLSAVSVAVLFIQLVIVSLIAAKYLYQRATCPRVWTRSAVYDPELFMRGRYLGLQITVDGCEAGTPSVKQLMGSPVRLTVEHNRLVAHRLPDNSNREDGVYVVNPFTTPCAEMVLMNPVYFYIAEHAASPLPVKPGDELWIEVTLPPKGPPRPIQLALKHADGAWQPLTYR